MTYGYEYFDNFPKEVRQAIQDSVWPDYLLDVHYMLICGVSAKDCVDFIRRCSLKQSHELVSATGVMPLGTK